MKRVKIITIILAIILVTLVAFVGVYVKTQNRMENKIKDYSFGRELEGTRVVEIKVATSTDEEDKANTEDLTVDNYEIVKKTIEQRLNSLGAQDYTISLNKNDGTIRVELQEDDNTDIYVYFLTASGEVKIAEEEGEALLTDSMVEKSIYSYTSNVEGAYQVYMELYLTKEGQAKIEEIKNNYAIFADEIEAAQEEKEEGSESEENATKTEDKSTEEETVAPTVETKKIAKLTIAESEYDITKIEGNKIRVNIGDQTTNNSSINNNLAVASELALLINSGKYPLTYEIGDNRFEYTDITDKQMLYFAITIAGILLIVFIVFIIKYKVKGLLASISFIGFLSVLTLLLRYTNVSISIEGIGAIIIVLIINIIINRNILNKLKNTNNIGEVVGNTFKEVFLKLIPVIIVALVFCFAGVANLSSFGMVIFWGLVLIALYNVTVTSTLLKLKESK